MSARTKRIALLSPVVLLAAQFSNCATALADPLPGGSTQTTGNTNLDLSSTVPIMNSGVKSPVNIKVGNAVQTVTNGAILTPAQFVAASQVASTGAQSIQLAGAGNAVGGTVNIGPQFSNAGTLVIPQGVTAINNVASAALNLTGNLNNFGTLLAISNNSAITTATIGAANIFNNPGALITTVIPQGGVPGYKNLVSNLNLHLSALENIVNSGTISSAGNLTAVAGGTISNVLPAAAAAGISAPQMTALGNVSLVSGMGQFVNSGLIQAMGSVTFAAPANDLTTNVSINNTGGVIAALGQPVPGIAQSALDAGLINVREHGYSGTGNTDLVGGDWHANQINLNGGQGQVEVAVEKMDGKINMEAGIAHVLADTPLLTLGDCAIAGDPTYVNIGGAIQISGTLTETAALAIIAQKDVTATGAAQIVDRGNPVWIIAGAAIDTANGSATGFGNTGTVTPPTGKLTGGFIQVTAAGGFGGNVDLSGSSLASGSIIDSSSNVSGSAGGNVTIVAVANGATGGRVIFPTGAASAVNASGLGTGANGNVEIYSGASSGAASIHGITNNGGSGTAGNVTIKNAQVTFGGGAGAGCVNCISFDQNGIATGSINSTTPALSTTTITGSIAAGNGTVSIDAGAISNSVGATISAKTINLTTTTGSNGAITLNANVTGSSSVSMITNGTGILTVAATATAKATNGTVSVLARNLTLAGSLDAGTTGTVSLNSNLAGAGIGLNGSATGTFLVSAAEMGLITAGTLKVGDSGSGNISQTGTLDVSGTGAGAYNLDYTTGGTITMAITTLGGQSLTTSSVGATTTGSISGSNAVNITAGNIAMNNNINLGATGTVTLLATASGGDITRTLGSITAKSVSLQTTGSGASNISTIPTVTSNLTLNTVSGNVIIDNTGFALSLKASTVTGTFDVSNNNLISVDGAVSASSTLKLSTTVNGSIALNSDLSGTAVTLAANGTGTITQTASKTLTGSTSIEMTSTSGAIGSISTSTNTLVVNTTGAVNVTNKLNFLDLSTKGASLASLSISNPGEIDTSSAITSAGAVSLTTTANNGRILLGGNLSGSIVSLSAHGSGSISHGAISVTGTTSLSLSSTSGDVDAVLSTVTPSLTVNTTGTFRISNTAANLSFSSGGSKFALVDLTNTGNITIATAVNADSSISIFPTGANSSFTVNGNLTSASSSVLIGATGTGILSVANGVTVKAADTVFATGNTINLNTSGKLDAGTFGSVLLAPAAAATTIGFMGGAGTLQIDSPTLANITAGFLTIGQSGSGAITQAGSLNISDTKFLGITLSTGGAYTGTASTSTFTGTTFQIDSLGAVNLGTITSDSTLTVTGDTITLQKNVNVGSASLTTNALSGLISTAAGATLTANSAFLTTKGTTSNIGTSAASRLQTAVSNLQLSTTSGNVFINNTTGTTLNLAPSGNVTVTGSITLDTNGPLSMAQSVSGTVVNLTSSGNITQTAGKTLTGSTSIDLFAGSGNIGSLNTTTPDLTVNTTGTATVVNTTAAGLLLRSGGSTLSSLSVTTNHALTVSTAISATGTISLATTGATEALTVSGGNVIGNAGVSLSTAGTGAVVVNTSRIVRATASGASVDVTAGAATFTAGSLESTGTNGTVILQPNSAGVTIGLNGGAGTFTVDATELGNIIATNVQIGNSSAGTITEAGTVTPAFNLDLRSGGNFVGASTTGFTLGGNKLTMDIAGSVQLGTVSGVATTVTINAGSVILGTAVANNLNLSGSPSTVNITTTASGGTITQFAGTTVTAQNVLLQTTGLGASNIGAITVSTSNLTLSTVSGNATVTNTSGASIGLNTSSVTGNIAFATNAGISVNGAFSATGTNSLTTAGANNFTGTGTISGSSVALITGSGTIGSGSATKTATASLSLTTTGIASVSNTTAGTLTLSGPSTFSSLTVATTNALSTSGTLSSAGVLDLSTGNNSTLTLGTSASGGTVTLTANGSGAISQTAGTLTGSTSISLNSTSGTIGSLKTATPSLTLKTTGSATVTNTGTLSLSSGGSTFSSLTVSADNSISTANTIATSGVLQLTTTASNGSITVSSDISGTSGINFTTQGSGALIINNGFKASSTNSPIVVKAGSVNFNTSGKLDAGTGTVTLLPNTAGTTIGLNGGVGTFTVTGPSMTNITAGTLQVGDNTMGSLTQAGSLNLSGSGAGKYDLDLRTGGSYLGTGSTTTLGAHNLSITAGSTGAGVGTISGTSGNVTISGGSVVLNNSLPLGSGTANITATAAAGTITPIGGASITASTVNLKTTGSGASDIGPITISAGNVTINTTSGNATVTNASAALVFVNSSSVGGNLTFSSDASISVGASGVTATGTNSISSTGGSISLSGNVSGTVVTMSVPGANGIDQFSGLITGSTSLSLTSGSGDIQSSGTMLTSTPNLTVNTTGDVNISNTTSAGLSLSSGGATFRNLLISTNRGLTTATALTASQEISLTTTANSGAIILGANVTTTGVFDIKITTDGSGKISQTAGKLITGLGTVSLSSASGDISSIDTNTSVLSINTSGNVSVDNAGSSGALSLKNSGATFASVVVTNDNGFSLAGTGPFVSSGAFTLTATANNGGFVLFTPVTAATVSLSAHGNGDFINNGSSTITGSSSLTMTSSSGSILGVFPTSTPSLTVGTTGSVDISNTTAGTLSLASTGTTFSAVTVSTDHGLTNTSALTSTGNINLSTSANNGSIVLANSITIPSGSAGVSVTAHGSGTITQSGGTISTSLGVVSLTSTSGDIGPIGISNQQLSVSTTGNIVVTNTSPTGMSLTSNTATSKNTTISNNGGIFVATNMKSAGTITLSATANNGGIQFGGTVDGAALVISAHNSGSITQSSGSLLGNTISLSSTSGNIGNIATGSPSITVNTTGSATVTNTTSGSLSINSGGTTFSSLSVTTNRGLVQGTKLDSTGAVSLVTSANNGGITLNDDVTGTSITVSANGSGAITQAAGKLTGSTSVSLSSGSGAITNIVTATSSLSASGGTITLTNTGALTSFNSAASTSLILSNNNSIDIGASGVSSSGAVSLSTTANNGSINVNNGSVTAGGLLSLAAHGTGTVNIGASKSVSTTSNNDISVSSAGVAFTGTVNAGSGSVTLKPSDNTSSIGINGASGTYAVAPGTLGQITASTVIVGSALGTGAIAANAFSPSTNLTILGSTGSISSTFTNNGTLSMGGKSLTITVGGAISTGTITGAANTISLTGRSISLGSGNITLSGASSATLHATGASGAGSISGTGTITSATLVLSSDNDFIGQSSGVTPLATAASTSLSANAGGAIDISNTGALSAFSSTASTALILSNNNSISIAAAGVASSGAVTISTTANNGSINVSNGSVSAGGTLSLTTQGTGTVTVGTGKSLSTSGANNIAISSNGNTFTGTVDAGAGTVTLTPNNAASSIGVNGGAGSYQVTGLGQITAGTLVIGSVSGTGAIDVSTTGNTLNLSSNLTFLASTAATTTTFTNNGGIDMGSKNLTITVGGAVTAGTIIGTGNALSITARSITIDKGIQLTGASSASLHATGSTGNGFIAQGAAGGLTTQDVVLLSDNDFIGTSGAGTLALAATTLSAKAAGSIFLGNATALTSFTSAGSTSISLFNNDSVSIGAGNITSSGTVTIQTNFNNGSINLNNGSIFANGIVSLTTEGTGTLTVGAGKTLSSTGNDISITSAGVSLTGTLNAGATGKVSITPTNTSSSIGVNGGAGTIQVTGLSQITADTLEIGAPSLTGKITVNSAGTPLNASYNLTFTGNTADSNNAFQSNDAINMGGKTLVINVGGAATLDDITGTANIVVVNARSISADTVTLTGGASVLSMNGTTGIVQTGGPFTAGSASLTALGGAAGTVTTPLNTATSSLTTNAFESNISNTGVLNGLTASSTTTLKVVNDNSITVSGGGITAGGALTLTTSANNGNIDINSSSVSSSGGLIQLTTDGSGAVQVNAFGLVSTTGGNDITLTSSSISIAATGSVNSGTGLVTLRPVNTASTIGVAGGAGTFQLTAPTLSQITAKTIVIGQATGTGNIQVGAGASLTKDITFLSNTGDFVNPGTISIGSNLTVTTTSGTITTGKINGAANTVTLTGKLIIAGDINLSGASTITMHATGAKGAGSITNPGATITAATISLTSDNDFIGSDDGTTQFQTASGSLSAAAGGGICIANTGALTSFTSSTSSRLDFFNNNTINIGAAGVNSSGPVTIATFANNGSIIANNGSITTGASAISLSTVGTGTITIGAGKQISNTGGSGIVITSGGTSFTGALIAGGGTGTVTLFPTDINAGIGINGGAGTIQFSGLQQISADTVTVGINTATGAIELGTAGTPFNANYNLTINGKTSSSSNTFKNNDTVTIAAGKQFNVNVGGALTTGSVTGSGVSTGVSMLGRSVNVNDNITISGAGATVQLNASGPVGSGGITGTGTISSPILKLTAIDDIGGGTPLSTSAATISLNASKAVNISNNSALTVSTITNTPTSIQISNNNTINGGPLNSSGPITLTTTANNGSINLSAGSFTSSGGAITLATNGTGTVTVGGGFSLSSATSDVTITSAGNTITGTISAGGNVTLMPTDSASTIGVNGGTGSFQVTASDLSKITANTIIIGSTGGTAAIDVNAPASTLNMNWNMTFLGSTAVTTSSFTNSNVINLNDKTLIISVGGPVNLGTINGKSNSSLSATGSSIGITGIVDLLGTSSLTLHATGAAGSGAISGVPFIAAKTISLTSDNDFIGPITTMTSSLSANAAGAIDIVNQGSLSNLSSTSSTSFTLSDIGSISVAAAGVSSSGAVSLSTSINGSIDVSNGSVAGGGTITLAAGGTGTVTVGAGKSVSTPGDISISSADNTFTGTLVAGSSGVVTLMPSDSTSSIGVNGGAGTYQVTSADLSQITAGTIEIGSNSGSGAIDVNGVGGTLTATTNLTFKGSTAVTTSTFTNNGTIALGAKALTVDVGGAVTLGTVTGNATTVTVTGQSIVVNQNLTLSGASNTVLHAFGAFGSGSIAGTGTITSATLSLDSDNDSISPAPALLNTKTSSLTANAAERVRILNTGSALTITNSSSGPDYFEVFNDNNIIVGTGGISTSGEIYLVTNGNNGSVNLSNGSITGSLNVTTDGTGTFSVGAGQSITGASTVTLKTAGANFTGTVVAGAVTIAPNSNSLSIGVNGGAGSMQITGLGQVTASAVQIGSGTGTGAINVNTPGTPLNANWDLTFLGSTASFTNNDTIAMGAHNLTINTGGAITLGNITGTGKALNASGTSININGSVNLTGASTANLTATGSTGSGAVSGSGSISAGSISLVSNNDFIGKTTGSTPLSTKTSSLFASASGGIDISNSGALTVNSSNSSQFTLSNDNSITVNAAGISSTGAVNLSNTSGSINVNSAISAGGTLSVSANGVLSSTATMSTAGNNNINLSASSLSLGSTVNAGTGTIALAPSTTSATIGVNGGTGSFQVSAATLGQLTAGTVVIGSNSGTGAIDVNTAGTPLNAATNLTFLASTSASTATFTNNDTINMGAKSLTVNVGGAINLGTVSGTGTVSFNTPGNVTLTGAGNLNLGTSTANALTLNSPGTITAANNITATGAVIVTAQELDVPTGITLTGASLSLTGQTGSALTLGNAGTIVATTGDINVTSPMDKDLILGVVGQTGNITANAGTINFTAPASDGTKSNMIDIVGSQTLTGNTFMNAPGASQQVKIEAGVTVNSKTNLVINTPFLNNLGVITGKLVISAQGVGTIANTNPAVNLDLKNLNGGSFTFLGQILTIVSASGIVNTATSSTINLSGTTQAVPPANISGGTLNLIAGFNFTGPTTSPSLPPNTGTYLLDGSTNAGKNIDLSKTTINTSDPSFSGNVNAVATGSIKMGPINTSASATGIAGNVTLIGNGVTTSTINSSGLNSGTISITSGTAAISGGSLTISNGVITKGSFTTSALGGNIKVGAITGGNGNINLTTGGTGTFSNGTGAITTTGTLSLSNAKGFTLKTAASNLQLNTTPNAFTSNVTITSSVLATLQNSTVGGNLTVNSAFGLAVGNNAVVTSGAKLVLNNTSKTADLKIGSAAVLTAGVLTGAPASPAPIAPSTTVTKAGSISLTSSTNTGTALTVGNNAQLIANGGSITIKSTFAGANLAIGDSPALGPNLLQANGGSITISSLGNTTVGGGGTGAHMLARALGTGMGAITISGKNAVAIGDNSVIQANKAISLTASAATSTFLLGKNVVVGAGFGGGLAGALSMTASGTGPNSLFIDDSFNFQSNLAALTLSAKGTLNTGDNGLIQATGGALTVKSTGTVNISALGAAKGVNMTATKVGSAGGALTITAAGNGITVGGPSTMSAAGILKVSNTSKTGVLTIDDGAQITGVGASSISSAGTPDLAIGDGASISNAGALTIKNTAGGVSIGIPGGTGTNITTTSSTGSIKISSLGNLAMGAGTTTPSTTFTLSATGSTSTINLQDTAVLNADSATIAAPAGVTLTGTDISTEKNLTVTVSGATGNLTVNGSKLTAGVFGTVPPPNQPFDPLLVASKGSLVLTAGNQVNIGNNNDWESIGGNITVTAKASNMVVGTNASGTLNSFVANGGNIVMLAKGTVTGANGNFFHAIGMGTSASNNVGGGIEVGSGLTSSSALNSALNLKGAPINPPAAGALGTGVVYTGNINGVIQANNKSGNANAINLNFGANGASQLFLNGTSPAGARGGAQVFDAATPTSQINFDNATFQTEAFKPIAMTSSVEIDGSTPVQFARSESGTTEVQIGNASVELQTFADENGSIITTSNLPAKSGKANAQIFARPNSRLLHKKNGHMHLASGEIFLNASNAVKLSTESATLHADKGALVSVRSVQGCTYIRACSANGTVNIQVNNKTITLNAGEELLLTNHKPDSSELQPEDGVGRRHAHSTMIGKTHATISDFAIITLLSSCPPLADLRTSPTNKHIVARMLKTAATIDVVLKHRGPYIAH